MPVVDGKHYPYTKQGYAQAAAAKKKKRKSTLKGSDLYRKN